MAKTRKASGSQARPKPKPKAKARSATQPDPEEQRLAVEVARRSLLSSRVRAGLMAVEDLPDAEMVQEGLNTIRNNYLINYRGCNKLNHALSIN